MLHNERALYIYVCVGVIVWSAWVDMLHCSVKLGFWATLWPLSWSASSLSLSLSLSLCLSFSSIPCFLALSQIQPHVRRVLNQARTMFYALALLCRLHKNTLSLTERLAHTHAHTLTHACSGPFHSRTSTHTTGLNQMWIRWKGLILDNGFSHKKHLIPISTHRATFIYIHYSRRPCRS